MSDDFQTWSAITQICEKYASKTAIVYHEQSMTYEELYISAQHWKETLERAGIRSGMRVLIMYKDPRTFLFLWLALWYMRCAIIPLDEDTPTEKLKHAFDSCECHYAVSREPYEDFVGYEAENDILYIRCFTRSMPSKQNDSAVIFYTSGTTGDSKCVVFGDQAMASNLQGLCACVEINSDDVVYTPLKISLTAALTTAVLPALTSGATLVLTPSKIPASIWKVLRDNHVTILFSVPYVYDMLTQTEACSTEHSLRMCLTCSAYMDPKIYNEFFQKTNCAIHSIYCSSEAGVISYVSSQEQEKLVYTVGKAVKGVNVRVVDDNGISLQIGEAGQIEVSGCNLAEGYYKRDDLTNKVFVCGWVKTGDLGYMDTSGYIHLVGRVNDVLNISGHMVGVQEIERVINQYPPVKDSTAYGLTDVHSHQSVACYLVLNDATEPFNENAFLQFCRLRMPTYQVPKNIQVVSELPQSRYGKKKRVLTNG